jgi:uncharacterized membrane protein
MHKYRINRKILLEFLGIVIPFIFALLLGYYNYLMVESYNYTVFDLGLDYRLMYLFFHSHIVIWSGTDIIFSPIPYSKLIFIPLSLLLFLNHSIYMPLLIQISIISVGGYALFGISKIKTESYAVAVSLEIMYFLYPATYGFMANGANYIGYLASFILIGYLLYLKKRYYLSFVFFIFAAISNTWGPLIVIVFIVSDLIANFGLRQILISKHIVNKICVYFKTNRTESLFLLFVLISSSVILSVIIFLEGGISGALGDSRLVSISVTSTTKAGSSLLNQYLNGFGNIKLPFLNDILYPFLYVPATTIYFVPVLIYILLIWSTNPGIAGSYEIISQHYSYIFISFIFIGAVHFFKKTKKELKSGTLIRKLLFIMIISSLVSFALNSPFSVNNFQNGSIHKLSTVSQFDNELTHGLNLIPMNSTVFIQNDIPQLMNRAKVYMPGYYHNATVDYSVIIPFGFSPISTAYSGYSLYWADHFQNNRSYGIFEEIENAYVYKLGYKGSPVIFIPMSKEITVGIDGFEPVNTAESSNGNIVVSNVTSGETIWDGGWTNFYPGTYRITYEIRASNTSAKNQLNTYVMINNGVKIVTFNNLQINGSMFSGKNLWTNFTTSVTFDNFQSGLGVQFQASTGQWSGTLWLKEIIIQQVGPD